MARRPVRNTSSKAPLTRGARDRATLPTGPVTTTSGSVELVLDRDDDRSLTVVVNGAPSSFIDLDDPTNVGFEYMECMRAVLDEIPAGPLDVVHLGAAGCAMARLVEATRPGSRQIGIDVDERLMTLAREWFDLPRSPRLRLRTGDARSQLASLGDQSADVVIRDVFAPDTTPDHLLTAEFLADVRRVLRPGGTYLVNCADRPPLTGARIEVATLRTAATPSGTRKVPGEVAIISEPALLKGRRYGNLVLALTTATEDERAWTLGSARLARALRSLAVPAHILTGDTEIDAFAGSALPAHDAPAPAPA